MTVIQQIWKESEIKNKIWGSKALYASNETRDNATNVKPRDCSFLPKSITALSIVCPCDLWIVRAYANRIGYCVLYEFAL
ncbi:hypothetical protein BpHYR1_012898 [Brachionus plicatilis]|uniref:Uncharacterized protein n=1 Tax=Brachionus plicatilis TaxID=10195 RepID=A0A3M7PY60_BRAPC|nr:hypothetical protein BpHYR1_012898 [Brachionus plicatilis]